MLSWFQPIVSVLDLLLTSLYRFTHDWGLAIIALTFIVRLILFGMNLQTYRGQVRQRAVQPLLLQLREKYRDQQERLLQETMKLNRDYGIKPFSILITALVQMPIFMSLFRLFTMHGDKMTSWLVSWTDTLAASDSWHIVPIVSACLTFAGSMIPLTTELSLAQAMRKQVGFSLVINIIYLIVLWGSPIALGLYYAANALFALAEKFFYRTAWGQALLHKGIRPVSGLPG